jgi:UDP-N-acetylmuramoyl-tripeptide--D-alanyl-D-alanine ligase
MITNIGKAHLEGFGGIQGVRIGKGELYEFLYKSGGTVFLNNDDQTLSNMALERGLANTIGYGTGDHNFVSARLKNSSPCLSIDWNLSGEPKHVAFSNLPGIYNFDNICAAICIGSYFNLSPEKINKGINAYQPLNNRSQILETPNNTIICDYYNANPSSMTVALDNLDATDATSKVLILGDMFELGKESANEHRLILEKALLTKAERRIFIGEEFYKLKGIEDAEFYKNTSQALEALNQHSVKQSTILLKGSRGMKLESLLNLF